MSNIDEMCAEVFYERQEQLFTKPVVQSADEAEEFLCDCMAMVFDSKDELCEFMKDEGIDTSDYEDVTEALEVFELPDGRFLYVEA